MIQDSLVNELMLLLGQEESSSQTLRVATDARHCQDESVKKPVKTFLQYQCDAIIYHYLAIAGHLPNAPLHTVWFSSLFGLSRR